MDDLYDPNLFTFSLPVFTLLNQAAPMPFVVLDNKAVPLFTDGDLAKRFQASIPGLANYELGAAMNPWKLLELLSGIQKRGFTHVFIDPSLSRGQSYSITELRATIVSKFGENPPAAAEGHAD